jgi:serine/threonine protein kinase
MSIRSYGFLSIDLDEDLSNICEVLPQAREIARLGRSQTIQGEPWRFLDRSLVTPGSYVGWHMVGLYREGSYGKIYKADRMVVSRRTDGRFDVIESPVEVIVKQTSPPSGSTILPAEDVTAHTSEALLHVLSWQTMQRTTTPWAIPRPYEVFGDYSIDLKGWLTMSMCMSYVQGRTLYSYMQRSWKKETKEANSRFLIELLGQLAFILHHLQEGLRLNHRDVKINNIMIRSRSSRDPFLLDLSGSSMTVASELTLIDFGFACVGCPPPMQPTTAFQAGSWFPMRDICCKKGRDLAQLLFCIHCYFPLDAYITTELCAEIRSWLQIPWSGGVANALKGFTKEGRPASGSVCYDTGIYEFLRRPEVDPVSCEPLRVFAACCALAL